MRGKIWKALMEGIFLQKVFLYLKTRRLKPGQFILSLLGDFVAKLDWLIGTIYRRIYSARLKVNPRQIMFIAFQGDYTCNPKYIAEELRRRGAQCRVVFSARWASLKNPNAFPRGYYLVEQYSAAYYKEIAQSKIIVANSVEFLKKPIPKKRGQICIETWHGSLGIKRFGPGYNHGKTWVAAAKRCGRYADYLISNSGFEDKVYRETYWKKTPILKYGHPRNDILFCDEKTRQGLKKKVLQNYESKLQHKLLLYAPTFRDNHSLEYYNIDFEQLLEALKTRFGGTWSILIRLHPTVRRQSKEYRTGKKVIDVSAYPDIQEIISIADIAITDYSSWIYDFVLTGRPGFIYGTDLAEYMTERGLYYPISSTPFPLASNNKQLIQNVLSFNEQLYQERLKLFLKDKHCMEDGNASKRVADKIIELMGDGIKFPKPKKSEEKAPGELAASSESAPKAAKLKRGEDKEELGRMVSQMPSKKKKKRK